MGSKLAPAIASLIAEETGDRRVGQFYLVEQIGKGSFAPVFLAREKLGLRDLREVAIKLFAVDSRKGADVTLQSEIQRERIVEEVRALVAVEHPNIVKFYTIATNEKHGVIGLVMEYVHGQTVDALIGSFASRPEARRVADLLDVGGSVASALSAMHQRDLLHRDVKPANVIESAGLYKLIDFGIAAASRAPGDTGGSTELVIDGVPLVLTRERARELGSGGTGTSDLSTGGTTGYQDPACLSTQESPTPLSDLYALGAMLFQCAAGAVPAAYVNRLERRPGLDGDVLLGAAGAAERRGRRAVPPARAVRAHRLDAPAGPTEAATLGRGRGMGDRAHPRRHRRSRAGAAAGGRGTVPRAGPLRTRAPRRVLRPHRRDRDRHPAAPGARRAGHHRPIGQRKEQPRARGNLAGARRGRARQNAEGVGRRDHEPRQRSAGRALGRARTDRARCRGDGRRDLIAALAERAQSGEKGTALLIDQLEELVTLASGESQAFLVRFLSRLAAQPVFGVRVIVAARQDLLPDLLRHRELGRVLTRDTQLVAPLSDRMWSEVLDQALDAYGYRLEDDALRDRLLHELEGTAMPLVQFALTRLWELRDRDKKVIPRAALDAIGGIAGALEVHGDATYERIAARASHAGPVTRAILLSLTTTKNTRATRTLEDLKKRVADPLTGEVVTELEAARLVTHDETGLTLAHEALLVQWGRLRGWLAEAHEDRLLADEVERDAEGWKANREPDRLWKKRRLIAAEDLLRRGNEALTEGARAFIRAGRAAARRGLITVASMAAALVVAITVATVWQVARLRAARDAANAKADEAQAATLRAKNAEADAVKARDEAVGAKNDAEARLRERNECMDQKDKLGQEEQRLADDEQRLSQAEKRAEDSARSAAQIKDEKEQQAARLRQECASTLAACTARCNQ